jgi:hypothetical protein
VWWQNWSDFIDSILVETKEWTEALTSVQPKTESNRTGL